VESVPFPSEDAVIARWQVRWDLNGHWLIVLILARWKVNNLEPFLLSIRLADIIRKINSTISNVSSSQLPLHGDVSTSLEVDPLVLRRSRIIATYKLGVQ